MWWKVSKFFYTKKSKVIAMIMRAYRARFQSARREKETKFKASHSKRRMPAVGFDPTTSLL